MLVRSMLQSIQVFPPCIFKSVFALVLSSFNDHVAHYTEKDTQNDDSVKTEKDGKDLALFGAWLQAKEQKKDSWSEKNSERRHQKMTAVISISYAKVSITDY